MPPICSNIVYFLPGASFDRGGCQMQVLEKIWSYYFLKLRCKQFNWKDEWEKSVFLSHNPRFFLLHTQSCKMITITIRNVPMKFGGGTIRYENVLPSFLIHYMHIINQACITFWLRIISPGQKIVVATWSWNNLSFNALFIKIMIVFSQ